MQIEDYLYKEKLHGPLIGMKPESLQRLRLIRSARTLVNKVILDKNNYSLQNCQCKDYPQCDKCII